MSNLHRIIWIDKQIRQGRYPNCRTIAREFEISPRQASRDIEYLRYSLGAPIEYCPGNNGYRYSGDTFVLPAHFLTQEEKDTLDYLAFQYRSRGGGQAVQLARLFIRLTGEPSGHGTSRVPIFNPGPGEAKAYKLLSQAQGDQHKVEIEYVNAGGVRTKRVFCPYYIFSQGDKGYVAGYCELRQEIRVLKLERIADICGLEERFQVVPWFDSEVYQKGFDYREPFRAEVKAPGKNLQKAGVQVLAREEEKYIVQFAESGKLISALLNHGGSFSILHPRWLRSRLQARLFRLLEANFADVQGCDTICPTPPVTMVSEYEGGGTIMAKKLDTEFGMTWTTYIGSVDGALRKADLWDGEIYKLMGMTGMAFHFIMHKTACPSSVTVYDWDVEHFAMMDRIGVHSEIIMVLRDPKLNTYRLVQEDAVAKVKASIDRGVPVVTWAPAGLLEFGLITGYDDEDKVLFVKDCVNLDPDPLLYTNLGVSEVPYLFVQIFKGQVDVEPDKVYRDSLEYGLAEWKKEQHVSPDYASGRKAYANLIGTLEREDFNDFGLAYNLSVYADSKSCIAKYLEFVSAQSIELPGLEEAAQLYRQVAEKYQEIIKLVPFTGPESKPFDHSNVPAVLDLVRQCLDLEERAMAVIERALA